MRCQFLSASLLVLLGVSGVSSASAADAESLAGDEQTLKAANLGTDGPALLDYFRYHTPTDADHERIDRLIKQLGDRAFRVREKASAELVRLGPKAIAPLRAALKNADLELSRRASECLHQLEKNAS